MNIANLSFVFNAPFCANNRRPVPDYKCMLKFQYKNSFYTEKKITENKKRTFQRMYL